MDKRVLIGAAGLVCGLSLVVAGCELLIPDVTEKQSPSAGSVVVKDGRLRPIPLVPMGAGSVSVVDADMDVGPPACSGEGARRTCVRGGITPLGAVGRGGE